MKKSENPDFEGDTLLRNALAMEPGGNEYVKKKKKGAYLTHYELFGEAIIKKLLQLNKNR